MLQLIIMLNMPTLYQADWTDISYFEGLPESVRVLAMDALNTPYRSGMIWIPDRRYGIRQGGSDCSGLAKGFLSAAIWKEIPRTTSGLSVEARIPFQREQLQPMVVIVFEHETGRHVAVYLGGNYQVAIHARKRGHGVQLIPFSLNHSYIEYWLDRAVLIYRPYPTSLRASLAGA